MPRLTLITDGDRHVVVTRRFDASPEAVYRAHTEPALVQQWMLGPDGWTMPTCESDLRPGGAIRYEWRNADGAGFHLTGEWVALEPFSRLVHVERMHLPDPTPDNHIETRFEADGTGTLMTMRMTLPDAATRAAKVVALVPTPGALAGNDVGIFHSILPCATAGAASAAAAPAPAPAFRKVLRFMTLSFLLISDDGPRKAVPAAMWRCREN